MRITFNPALPNPAPMVGTSMSDWIYSVTINHPETQSPIVQAGETVDPWSLFALVEAGADSITVQPNIVRTIMRNADTDWPADAKYCMHYEMQAWPCTAMKYVEYFNSISEVKKHHWEDIDVPCATIEEAKAWCEAVEATGAYR
jgi:hypothetical protein